MCAIRIWAKLDDAFKILVQKLNLTVTPIIPTIPAGDVYLVPYDQDGKKVCLSYLQSMTDLSQSDTYQMTLDLRTGAPIQIVAPGAMNFGATGTVAGKRDGNYSV